MSVSNDWLFEQVGPAPDMGPGVRLAGQAARVLRNSFFVLLYLTFAVLTVGVVMLCTRMAPIPHS